MWKKKLGTIGLEDQNTALIFCQATLAGFEFQAPSHNRWVFLDMLTAPGMAMSFFRLINRFTPLWSRLKYPI